MKALGVKWDVKVAAWEEGFSHLKKYFELNGHADIPKNFKSPDKYALGQWLSHQRTVYKKGNYPADRLERMNALGVKWGVLDAAWEEGFTHLKAYFDLNGHADVPMDFNSGKFPLGRWLSTQRRAYKKGKYPADRLERMNALGVKWSVKDAAWEEAFTHLQKYFDLNGHADVPVKFNSGKFPLGRWLSSQRCIHKKGDYPFDRLERMNALGVKWSVKKQD